MLNLTAFATLHEAFSAPPPPPPVDEWQREQGLRDLRVCPYSVTSHGVITRGRCAGGLGSPGKDCGMAGVPRTPSARKSPRDPGDHDYLRLPSSPPRLVRKNEPHLTVAPVPCPRHAELRQPGSSATEDLDALSLRSCETGYHPPWSLSRSPQISPGVPASVTALTPDTAATLHDML